MNGTSIINVSLDPPVEVANIIGPSSGDYYFHRDYKTYDNHLYIVNEMYGGDIGMQVIDLSPLPDNPPIQLNTYNGIGQSHNLWIDLSGYAYIEHQSGDNIHIVNLMNPSNPIYESSFGNQALNCHDIYSRDNIAYVSEGWSNQFGIYDISNLNNITLLATIPCEGYAHNAWLNTNGTHLITTEETQNITIKIWDIQDLNNITLTGEYIGENGLAHNVHILNNHVYISHYTTGLKILDIFNPYDPIEVAAYDTYIQNDYEGFYGCWGAYPFTENNYIYASDMQNGLFVLEFDNINAGWVYGTLYINNQIAPNTTIQSLLNNKIFTTDNQGGFNFGFPEGMHQFKINNDTTTVNIIGHQNTNSNIYINNNMQTGDINLDNNIDVLDVIIAVNIILNNYEPNAVEELIADIDYSGNINIQDIILLIQIILN
jgi:choice-of-anchor B domain-containing protein